MAVLQTPPRQGTYTYAASLQRLSLAALTASGGALTARAGVRPGDLLVAAHGTPNMTVDVAAGFALVQATSAVGGLIPIANNGSLSVTVSAANATYARIDLIVARFKDEEDSTATTGNALATIEIVTGTPSASPAVPTTPANALVLAQLAVAANATTITSGNVADKRVYTAALGGAVVCTSTTRPTGGQLVPGLLIFETDTGASRFYDGAQWRGGITQEISVTGGYYVISGTTVATLCSYVIPAQPVPVIVRMRNYAVIDKTVATDVWDINLVRDGGASIRSTGTSDVGLHWSIGSEHSFSLAAGVSTTVSSTMAKGTTYTNTGSATAVADPRLNFLLITIDPS
jgi:hypothetical protein